jgi:serine/threonine protein kinase
MAPEVLLGKGYGLKADVWSFGILLCELVSGHSPFHADQPIRQYEKQLSGNY